MNIMRMEKPGATSNMDPIPAETGKNIQIGYMQIYSGAMIGIQSWPEAWQAAYS
jgi:hypothetical protein